MGAGNGPRVAIYSQDSLGLGHLRRTITIGSHFLEQVPGSGILLFADSPVAPFFQLPEGMDHIKLPSIRKVTAGQWEAPRLHLPIMDVRPLRMALLHEGLLKYRPDLLLVDHMPGGAQGELIPALRTLKRTYPSCCLVLGLRDILDAQEVIKRVWAQDGAYQAITEYYDGILIYGKREIFDTEKTYCLPTPPEGTHFCGYVASQGPLQPAQKMRESFGASADKKFVVVSAGGGGDGHLVMRTYMQAIRFLGSRRDFTTVIATGVNAPPDLYRELEAEAQCLSVRLVQYLEDSLSTIAAADLVVCMAGYNTLAEALKWKKKVLAIPRVGPSAEQRLRVGLFKERGLIDVIYPEELSPQKLAERILEDLQRTDYPRSDRDFETNGGIEAAAHLAEFVAKKAVGFHA
jgi:predicted glycosyltransferase